MTDEPMDYRDYLIRQQQQQERIAQRFDALFTKDEDHAAAATQRIEDQAYYDAQEAAAYDDVQESLTDGITQTRDLHAQIQSGIASEKDARELLADLGRQLAKLVGKIAPTKRSTTAGNRYRTAGVGRCQVADRPPTAFPALSPSVHTTKAAG